MISQSISEKENKAEKKERYLNGKENFKTESRYLKLCNELKGFIRCMKAAFYRPDYQKFLMRPLIKRLGQVFVSKHSAEHLKHLAELMKHSAELLRV